MRDHRGNSSDDPRGFVDATIVAALDSIVTRATIGFVVVAAFASLPLIFRMQAPAHAAFHFLVPVGWLVYALVTGVLLAWKRAPREPDVWERAARVDPGLTRLARRVSAVMTVGWLASLGAVLVHHHLTSPREIFVTLGIIVPLTLATWILAVIAWNGWCHASLARAEHEASERLRQYWRQVPRARCGP